MLECFRFVICNVQGKSPLIAALKVGYNWQNRKEERMKKTHKPKFIFVVGGVMSGVGKGVAASSIGALLQSRGFNITAVKIDPYVNVDAGTMNPTEHGEVFVLDDGTECDQDMGNYERFLNVSLDNGNYMTTGSIYLSIIQRERNLEFDGKCVSPVPHIPLEIIARIKAAAKKDKAEIVITEIGGTVGEYENLLFLEAARMLKLQAPQDTAIVLVSHLPSLGGDDGELKTKPTQHAVRSLNSVGLQPDVIIARARVPIDGKRKEKIAFHCGVDKSDVISAPDVGSIYEVPMNFLEDKVDTIVLKKLNLKTRAGNFSLWKNLAGSARVPNPPVLIGIIGKYFGTGNFILTDAYISVIEAVKHAAYALRSKPVVEWLNAEDFEKTGASRAAALKSLSKYDGLIVPGGFGARGVGGKINAIRHARENKIPYLGLCYGLQMAVIEFARNVAGLKDADTTEVNPRTPHPVIDILPEQRELMAKKIYGGTMRLGAYPTKISNGTVAYSAYAPDDKPNDLTVSERHRHRYEVNPAYIARLEKAGLIFSGCSPDGGLMEIAELPKSKHPFFLSTQFHPELKSRPMQPHPLFLGLVKAAVGRPAASR